MRHLATPCILLLFAACTGRLMAAPPVSPPVSPPGRGGIKGGSAEERQKATDLVQKLGDRSYRARQEAGRELTKMGEAAKPALEEGLKHDDPEVRRRCQNLLAGMRQAAMKARLDAFLADKEGKGEHDLPGWKLFREVAGDGKESRKFFAEMYQMHTDLLAPLESSPAQAGQLVAARCEREQNAARGGGIARKPDAGVMDVAPLYLIAAHPKADLPRTASYYLSSLLYRPGVREALTDGKSAPFRKLVFGWIARETDEFAMRNALRTAMNLNLKETLGLALKLAGDKKAPRRARAEALVVIGKLGGKKHVPLIEQFLDDKTQIGGFGIGGNGGQINGQTQVRDVALAMLVQLTGQKHLDYDFAFARSQSTSLLWNAAFLGFSDDAERTAAFKRWQGWKAKQKK